MNSIDELAPGAAAALDDFLTMIEAAAHMVSRAVEIVEAEPGLQLYPGVLVA